MKNEQQQYVLVPYEKMDELLEMVKKLSAASTESNQKDNGTLGDYITEKEAKTNLNKGSTWFWNKRQSGDLNGRKAGGQWYYKKSDILKFIENGKTT